jgi:hypothetical protein
MLPAIIFFVCMCAFHPQIKPETLPADFMLARMGLPPFHIILQLMIFAALLECGTGFVHAINERIGSAYRRKRGSELPSSGRLLIAGCRVARLHVPGRSLRPRHPHCPGSRALSYIILVVYVIPLLTYGV